jgi:hypothetical protein
MTAIKEMIMRSLASILHRSSITAAVATFVFGAAAPALASDANSDQVASTLLSEVATSANSSLLLRTTIVGSWNCTGSEAFAGLRFLITYHAGGTFSITVSNRMFGDTRGIWERSGLTSFVTTEQGFLYDVGGIADRIQSVNTTIKLKSATELLINVSGVVNRLVDGVEVTRFQAPVACKRMLIKR